MRKILLGFIDVNTLRKKEMQSASVKEGSFLSFDVRKCLTRDRGVGGLA